MQNEGDEEVLHEALQRFGASLAVIEEPAGGAFYVGCAVNSLAEGIGISSWPSSDAEGRLEYAGHFNDGHRHGLGTMRFANNTSYEGEWKAGMPDGYGQETYPDGSTYIGQLRNDKRNGMGTYVYADKLSFYAGSWQDGLQHGIGMRCLGQAKTVCSYVDGEETKSEAAAHLGDLIHLQDDVDEAMRLAMFARDEAQQLSKQLDILRTLVSCIPANYRGKVAKLLPPCSDDAQSRGIPVPESATPSEPTLTPARSLCSVADSPIHQLLSKLNAAAMPYRPVRDIPDSPRSRKSLQASPRLSFLDDCTARDEQDAHDEAEKEELLRRAQEVLRHEAGGARGGTPVGNGEDDDDEYRKGQDILSQSEVMGGDDLRNLEDSDRSDRNDSAGNISTIDDKFASNSLFFQSPAASDGQFTRIAVKLQSDSIHDGVTTEQLVTALQSQLHDPESQLRQGRFGSRALSLRLSDGTENVDYRETEFKIFDNEVLAPSAEGAKVGTLSEDSAQWKQMLREQEVYKRRQTLLGAESKLQHDALDETDVKDRKTEDQIEMEIHAHAAAAVDVRVAEAAEQRRAREAAAKQNEKEEENWVDTLNNCTIQHIDIRGAAFGSESNQRPKDCHDHDLISLANRLNPFLPTPPSSPLSDETNSFFESVTTDKLEASSLFADLRNKRVHQLAVEAAEISKAAEKAERQVHDDLERRAQMQCAAWSESLSDTEIKLYLETINKPLQEQKEAEAKTRQEELDRVNAEAEQASLAEMARIAVEDEITQLEAEAEQSRLAEKERQAAEAELAVLEKDKARRRAVASESAASSAIREQQEAEEAERLAEEARAAAKAAEGAHAKEEAEAEEAERIADELLERVRELEKLLQKAQTTGDPAEIEQLQYRLAAAKVEHEEKEMDAVRERREAAEAMKSLEEGRAKAEQAQQIAQKERAEADEAARSANQELQNYEAQNRARQEAEEHKKKNHEAQMIAMTAAVRRVREKKTQQMDALLKTEQAQKDARRTSRCMPIRDPIDPELAAAKLHESLESQYQFELQHGTEQLQNSYRIYGVGLRGLPQSGRPRCRPRGSAGSSLLPHFQTPLSNRPRDIVKKSVAELKSYVSKKEIPDTPPHWGEVPEPYVRRAHAKADPNIVRIRQFFMTLFDDVTEAFIFCDAYNVGYIEITTMKVRLEQLGMTSRPEDVDGVDLRRVFFCATGIDTTLMEFVHFCRQFSWQYALPKCHENALHRRQVEARTGKMSGPEKALMYYKDLASLERLRPKGLDPVLDQFETLLLDPDLFEEFCVVEGHSALQQGMRTTTMDLKEWFTLLTHLGLMQEEAFKQGFKSMSVRMDEVDSGYKICKPKKSQNRRGDVRNDLSVQKSDKVLESRAVMIDSLNSRIKNKITKEEAVTAFFAGDTSEEKDGEMNFREYCVACQYVASMLSKRVWASEVVPAIPNASYISDHANTQKAENEILANEIYLQKEIKFTVDMLIGQLVRTEDDILVKEAEEILSSYPNGGFFRSLLIQAYAHRGRIISQSNEYGRQWHRHNRETVVKEMYVSRKIGRRLFLEENAVPFAFKRIVERASMLDDTRQTDVSQNDDDSGTPSSFTPARAEGASQSFPAKCDDDHTLLHSQRSCAEQKNPNFIAGKTCSKKSSRVDCLPPKSFYADIAAHVDTPVLGCSLSPRGMRVSYGTITSIQNGTGGRWVKRDLLDRRLPWDHGLNPGRSLAERVKQSLSHRQDQKPFLQNSSQRVHSSMIHHHARDAIGRVVIEDGLLRMSRHVQASSSNVIPHSLPEFEHLSQVFQTYFRTIQDAFVFVNYRLDVDGITIDDLKKALARLRLRRTSPFSSFFQTAPNYNYGRMWRCAGAVTEEHPISWKQFEDAFRWHCYENDVAPDIISCFENRAGICKYVMDKIVDLEQIKSRSRKRADYERNRALRLRRQQLSERILAIRRVQNILDTIRRLLHADEKGFMNDCHELEASGIATGFEGMHTLLCMVCHHMAILGFVYRPPSYGNESGDGEFANSSATTKTEESSAHEFWQRDMRVVMEAELNELTCVFEEICSSPDLWYTGSPIRQTRLDLEKKSSSPTTRSVWKNSRGEFELQQYPMREDRDMKHWAHPAESVVSLYGSPHRHRLRQLRQGMLPLEKPVRQTRPSCEKCIESSWAKDLDAEHESGPEDQGTYPKQGDIGKDVLKRLMCMAGVNQEIDQKFSEFGLILDSEEENGRTKIRTEDSGRTWWSKLKIAVQVGAHFGFNKTGIEKREDIFDFLRSSRGQRDRPRLWQRAIGSSHGRAHKKGHSVLSYVDTRGTLAPYLASKDTSKFVDLDLDSLTASDLQHSATTPLRSFVGLSNENGYSSSFCFPGQRMWRSKFTAANGSKGEVPAVRGRRLSSALLEERVDDKLVVSEKHLGQADDAGLSKVVNPVRIRKEVQSPRTIARSYSNEKKELLLEKKSYTYFTRSNPEGEKTAEGVSADDFWRHFLVEDTKLMATRKLLERKLLETRHQIVLGFSPLILDFDLRDGVVTKDCQSLGHGVREHSGLSKKRSSQPHLSSSSSRQQKDHRNGACEHTAEGESDLRKQRQIERMHNELSAVGWKIQKHQMIKTDEDVIPKTSAQILHDNVAQKTQKLDTKMSDGDVDIESATHVTSAMPRPSTARSWRQLHLSSSVLEPGFNPRRPVTASQTRHKPKPPGPKTTNRPKTKVEPPRAMNRPSTAGTELGNGKKWAKLRAIRALAGRQLWMQSSRSQAQSSQLPRMLVQNLIDSLEQPSHAMDFKLPIPAASSQPMYAKTRKTFHQTHRSVKENLAPFFGAQLEPHPPNVDAAAPSLTCRFEGVAHRVSSSEHVEPQPSSGSAPVQSKEACADSRTHELGRRLNELKRLEFLRSLRSQSNALAAEVLNDQAAPKHIRARLADLHRDLSTFS